MIPVECIGGPLDGERRELEAEDHVSTLLVTERGITHVEEWRGLRGYRLTRHVDRYGAIEYRMHHE